MPSPHELDVWMRWEFDTLNAGAVTRPKPVRALLGGDGLQTRDGEPYDIETGVVERIAAACKADELGRLRLPITLYFPGDVEDSAYLVDALAADVLHRLEGWGGAYPFRDGKMWLPSSLAVDLIFRYGGGLQRLFL